MSSDVILSIITAALSIATFQATVRLATPITLAALCGIWSERSGVVNIGIEGIMLSAACTGFLGTIYANQALGSKSVSLFVGLVAALATGLLLALLLGVLAVRFKTDQIIAGTVINILAVGATGYIYRRYLATDAPVAPGVLSPITDWPLIGPVFSALSHIPIIGPLLFTLQPIALSMLILVALTHYILFYTPWGLRTRSVGENPRAADTLGINVFRMRYTDVLIGGAIAGLAGAWYTLEQVGVFTPNMTAGRGFIGLAAMIFGKWNPVGAFLAALLFAFAEAIQPILQTQAPQVPYQFFAMIPYLLTIIVLAGLVGRATPPAADGKPYEA
ncbi:MAG: ABC transporter permease [Anaerolineae bacterium]|nr:ABC transporter permease [Anaerolineae bacterium]